MKTANILTQLPIKEIKDDVVLLKNNSLRAILMCSSLNFSLKSNQEQEAIIDKYQQFLNSLDFPVQITILSRRLNIKPYLAEIAQLQEQEDNELLRLQGEEYIDFVKGLVEMTNIVTKSFYLIVPFTPFIIQKQGLTNQFKKILGRGPSAQETEQQTQENFLQHKTQLWQRVQYILTGLSGAGIRMAPLNTDELTELFYEIYNPSAQEKQGLEHKEQQMGQI